MRPSSQENLYRAHYRAQRRPSATRRSRRVRCKGWLGVAAPGLRYLKQQFRNFLWYRDHRVVPGRELMVVVNAFRLRSSRTTPRFGTNAIDIGPRDHWSSGNPKVDRLVERSVRMRYEFRHGPFDVFTPRQAKPFRACDRDSPAFPLRSHVLFDLSSKLRPCTVEKTLSTSRDYVVQIHQP